MYFSRTESESTDTSWDLYLMYGLVNAIATKNAVEIYLGALV